MEKSLGKKIEENVRSLVGAICIYLVFKSFVVEAYRIPEPTSDILQSLGLGDWIFVSKTVYLVTPPRRGDLVIFESKRDGLDMISRVVGVAGDTVRVTNGTVEINGEKVDEAYLLLRPSFDYSVVVPEERLFVLPDVRAGPVVERAGSQMWGMIRTTEISGRPWFRYYPLGRVGFVPRGAEMR